MADAEQFFSAGRDVRMAGQLAKLIQPDVDQPAKPQPFILLARIEHAGIADQGFQLGADVVTHYDTSTSAPGQRAWA
ncbi:MAG: hypothetical protein EBT08_20030 [Betaproteobacteria bacterium]|nr:hypothetical protein [Betaproteobacteria bacterium]